MKTSVSGWLLDLYEHPVDGLVLWLVEEDGRRRRLRQDFPVTFYVAGPAARLRDLWVYLKQQEIPANLSRTERRDLFRPEPATVLAVETANPAGQQCLFRRAAKAFPELTYYDVDIHVALRHAAIYGTFPLARLSVAPEGDAIREIETLDTPWEIDLEFPPLRILQIEPDCDPNHAAPVRLHLRMGGRSCVLPLEPEEALLNRLNYLLRREDPDLLLTAWGDTWLLPRLLEHSARLNLPLELNRESGRAVLQKPERSYYAYGHVIHRGQQVQLFGRWHIDIHNAVMYHDYGLEGVVESARMSALPVQAAARLSPGTGISSMQILTALRQGVLVPWRKQQPEDLRSVLDAMIADQGGLVYQPIIGLHHDVAEIDFVSMYPGIMARFNVSPETTGRQTAGAVRVPELGLWINRQTNGLVPQTLKPLLEKRITLKEKAAALPRWDPRRKSYKAQAAAHKWLLVTCFGYLGYKNARFGRIEAHQAVTAYSRECLLRAKEAAEEAGFTVLHLYVDGLWVYRPGCCTVGDVQPLLDKISERTGLSVALDGIYRWVAFLPSRLNEKTPVANRYFGVFQDGSIKARGIESRRRDTPPFIARAQAALLELLAQAPDVEALPQYLPRAQALAQEWMQKLWRGGVPLDELVVGQRLSRTLESYRAPSPAARAATQLAEIGKVTRPGQTVHFIYTLGLPGVHAWDLPSPPPAGKVDTPRYARLLQRAMETVLSVFTSAGIESRLPCEVLGVGNTPPEQKPRRLVLF